MTTITLVSPVGNAASNFITYPLFTSWDPATAIGVRLSDLNLRVTNQLGMPPQGQNYNPMDPNTGPTLGYGVSIPVNLAQLPGVGSGIEKFYFEVKYTKRTDPSNGFPATFNGGIAVAPITSGRQALYAGLGNDYFGFGWGASFGVVCNGSGSIVKDGIQVAGLGIDPGQGSLQENDVIAVAVDINARAVWFRCIGGPSKSFDTGWNGSSSSGPNSGSSAIGLTIKGTGVVPMAIFGGETAPQSVEMLANFGEAPFIGNIPFFQGQYEFWPTIPNNP